MKYYINDVKTSRLAFARSLKYVSGFTSHNTVLSLIVLEHAQGLGYKVNGYTFKCVA